MTDACVLRDYLAEFAAAFVYRLEEPPRITTLSGLLRQLKHAKPEPVLTAKLNQASGPQGWLFELSSYRNLVTHSAPLALAQRRLWVCCESHELPDGGHLPMVRFPLPPEPGAIIRARSKPDYNYFKMLSEQFAGPAEINPDIKDALRYAHEVMGELALLALDLAAYSPVPPQMPTLTDREVEGPIRWTTW